MGIVSGVVTELQDQGIPNVCAHRRWADPQPGQSVTVVTSPTTWAALRTSAETPLVRIMIYSAPNVDQADAETVGEPMAAAVRRCLHILDGHERYWGSQRVIASQHVGSSLLEAEGHPSWRVRTLSFEVQTV